MNARTTSVLITLLAVLALRTASAEPVMNASTGALHGTLASGKAIEFPLTHTRAEIEVAGFVARATVTQTYENPFEEAIEAVYTFPLPQDAAVDHMTLQIGDRRVNGMIMRKQQAKVVYEQAKQQGYTAALLDQERTNVFTQQVANIQPGDTIEIEISYVDVLTYDSGRYELVFPMVAGPRFMAGSPLERPNTGSGVAPDTNRVPDASRISPPIGRKRSGHDIELNVRVDAGLPILGIDSPTHQITQQRLSPEISEIGLATEDTIPNKDFVLHFRTAGDTFQPALLTQNTAEASYFTLILQPPATVSALDATPREFYFVIDTSGSMEGWPLDTARAAAIRCISNLNPNDTFQIVSFDTEARTHFPSALGNTTGNVQKGIETLQSLQSGGGTDPLSAIRRIAAIPGESNRLRLVLFMTDGYVGDEASILGALPRELGRCRVFALGVGSSPNRALLDGMAEFGGGAVQYATNESQATEAAATFSRRINNPVFSNPVLDLSGLDPEAEVFPLPIPDVFDGQPVYLFGKVKRNAGGKLVLNGVNGRNEISTTIEYSPGTTGPDDGVIAKMWARQRIKSLEGARYLAQGHIDPGFIETQVTETALKYKLISNYTSFVAIEETPRGTPGQPKQVVQPVELPEGMEDADRLHSIAAGPPIDTAKAGRRMDFSQTAFKKTSSGAMGMAGGMSSSGKKAQLQAPRTTSLPVSGDSGAGETGSTGSAQHGGARGGGGALPAAPAANAQMRTEESNETLPARQTFQSVVTDLKPGVTADSDSRVPVQGGRDREVTWLQDGMNVTEPVTGTLGTNLNLNAIENMEVISGGFSQEYGSAMKDTAHTEGEKGVSGGDKAAAKPEEKRNKEAAAFKNKPAQPFEGFGTHMVRKTLTTPLGRRVEVVIRGTKEVNGDFLTYLEGLLKAIDVRITGQALTLARTHLFYADVANGAVALLSYPDNDCKELFRTFNALRWTGKHSGKMAIELTILPKP